MAKGYWIARVDVHNMDGYKEYVAQNGAVFNKYGAKFLVRGGRFVGQEGSSRSRNVVLEFKDYETALACYNSPEYARLVAIRSPHAESDLVIIEGYKGSPHPKLEVHRRALGEPLLAPGDPAIIAIASDIALPAATVPVVDLDDVDRIVDVLFRHAVPRDTVLAMTGQS